jgi:hypothetical protein
VLAMVLVTLGALAVAVATGAALCRQTLDRPPVGILVPHDLLAGLSRVETSGGDLCR